MILFKTVSELDWYGWKKINALKFYLNILVAQYMVRACERKKNINWLMNADDISISQEKLTLNLKILKHYGLLKIWLPIYKEVPSKVDIVR